MSSVLNEQTQFTDSGGNPIVNGLAYFGVAGSDPKISPITIFSDRDLTVALPNPQTLDANGRTTNKVWLPGRYSIKIEDVNNVQLYQELDNGKDVGTTTTALTNVLGTNAITADASPTITVLLDKAQFIFQIVSENTLDPVTLAIDGTGVFPIKRNFDQDIGKGKFKVGQTVIVAWNSGQNYYELNNENARVIFVTKGADIASAATIDLSLATGNFLHITGNTGPITSFGTVLAGVEFILVFDGTPTVNHSANLIMPGSANRTMVANDKMHLVSEGGGIARVLDIMPGTGAVLIIASQAQVEAGLDNLLGVTSLRVNQALENRIVGGIAQSDLKTSTGDMTHTTSTPLLVTGPGGEFGFWPVVKSSDTAVVAFGCVPLNAITTFNIGTSFLQRFTLTSGGAKTLTVRQRFVQASPPYDMGDGDVFSFIFAIINNATGLIEATYHAPDPPWANNGPTNIKPDRIDFAAGKQFKIVKNINPDKLLLMNPDFIQESEIEITHAFKNSDMALIPHPFQENDLTGKTIVLLDPMSKVVERLEDMKNVGGDPSEILYGNYLNIGQDELGRGRPPGVMSVSIAMK